jgi:Helix-turn-helix domain
MIDNQWGLWSCKRDHKFKQSFYRITNNNYWCPICTNKYSGEEICRKMFETIFQEPFPKYRNNWLKNRYNKSLELDGFCEKLNIAFEHNGEHHYKDNVFGNNFERIQSNDIDKSNLCAERGIKLIIIPQLGKILNYNSFVLFLIEEFTKHNILAPSPINIDMDKLLIEVANQIDKLEEHSTNMIKVAATNNGVCLSDVCVSVKDELQWQCERKHIWTATYNNVINLGQWCPHCAQRKHWIEKEDLVEMAINQRLSLTQISSRTNIPFKSVYDLAKHHGIQLHKSKLYDLSKDQLEDLYINQNLSTRNIGKQLAVSQTAIINKLKEFNIQRKPIGTNQYGKQQAENK